ncbi:MAG: MT-A70 family methyltransferase [Desulfomonilaceae bacterium]
MTNQPTDPQTALTYLDNARTEIQAATDLLSLKDIHDRLVAVRTFCKAAKVSFEITQRCSELKIRCERRAGTLLNGRDKHPPGPPPIDRSRVATYPPKIEDLGITKSQSSRWQTIAGIPDTEFEQHIEKAKSGQKEITSSGVLDLAREIQRRKTIQELEEEIEKAPPLPEGLFHVIVADPPWHYRLRLGQGSKQNVVPYPTMTLEEIEAVPVKDIAAEHCILWLWTTNTHLPDAFEVVKAWGFEYKTLLTWVKDYIGTGDWLRGQTEHCLMAVRGRPVTRLTNQATVIHAPRRDHSRKPQEFYELVESLCPGSKVELFARERREGWFTHGLKGAVLLKANERQHRNE